MKHMIDIFPKMCSDEFTQMVESESMCYRNFSKVIRHFVLISVDVISLHFHKILFLITFIKNYVLSCHIILQQAGQLLFNTYIPCKKSVKVLTFS